MHSQRPAPKLNNWALTQYFEDVFGGREKEILTQRLLDAKADDEQGFYEATYKALEYADRDLPELDGEERRSFYSWEWCRILC